MQGFGSNHLVDLSQITDRLKKINALMLQFDLSTIV